MKTRNIIAGRSESDGTNGTNGTNGTYRTYRTYRTYGLLLLLLLLPLGLSAQIKIGGSVYGGGNVGFVGGSTSVTVKAGDVNKVFGGARMANVGGNAYVNIDGEHATGYTVINYVYGGNDISGTIGTAEAVGEELPAELEGNTDGVDNTWNTYVHLSTKTTTTGEGEGAVTTEAADAEKTYIGQAFAGGNGDYDYTEEGGKYVVKSGDETIATSDTPLNTPELAKTYLDIQGGSIVYAYGGGNKATVTEKAIIHLDNPSKVVNEIKVDATGLEDKEDGTNILTEERFRDQMGINTGFSKPHSDEFQIGRLFGGNNLAEMSIMPRWNLQSGKVRNLYSGGNRGAMTSPTGLLLDINPDAGNTNRLVIDNVFGGCRMADVRPEVNGVYTPVTNAALNAALGPGSSLLFPDELSARVLVRGGDINNVYGGNDITGRVWGGDAVGIYASVRGDVYGGGNGDYPYTDKETLVSDDIYGDLFYANHDAMGAAESLTDLNNFRPNTEQVSIRLAGTSEEKPTIIGGSVYVGGNCATLQSLKEKPLVELKMGSHVIADQVFLGNNGAGMVRRDVLEHYADDDFSSLDLTNKDMFATYMEGVAMNLIPKFDFDEAPRDPASYVEYSSYVGSLFLGGNVGSMTYPGKNQQEIDHKLIIYNKVVGGCNNANVAAEAGLNAAYEGGIRGTAAEHEEGGYTEGGNIKDRLELTFKGLKLQPKRLYSTEYVAVPNGTTLTEGKTYYKTDAGAGEFEADGTEVANGTNYYKMTRTRLPELEWNTAKWKKESDGFVEISTDDSADDADRRLVEGNIYGGCYNSGHVNGNVVININQDVVDRYGEHGVFHDDGERRSGVTLFNQVEDVMSIALTVFGAGYGEDTEIWGSTTVNHNNGYAFQIFGGGEEGVVGKKDSGGDYAYAEKYSSTVNLNGLFAGYAEGEGTDPLPESENLYGGGSEGLVCGDTHVYLGNGRIYDAFGGSSNADILGAAEVYIGRQRTSDGTFKDGFPWIRDNIYGGNDFGGIIRGTLNHPADKTPFDPDLLESSTFVKYIQGRVDTIFGGGYGYYDYKDRIYKEYTDVDGKPLSGFSFPGLKSNSYVHFQPLDNPRNAVGTVFGGSEGAPDHVHMNNVMQKESYVYVNDEQTKDGNRFATTDIYGGGAYAGVGEETGIGSGRTVVDLFAGKFNNVYGGSNKEGLIGAARVNVPSGSKINVNAIFGGGKGYDDPEVAAIPGLAARFCDTYVTCVDYQGADAIVRDAIYGGNHNRRIAFDTYVNVGAEASQGNGYQATIYGAGYGNETVSGRTNIYMNSNSNAYKVFGGGRDGNVYNFESLKQWLGQQFDKDVSGTPEQIATAVAGEVATYGGYLQGFRTYIQDKDVRLPSPISDLEYKDGKYYDNLWKVENGQLKDTKEYYNTNVHINEGGNVTGYAYGGGYGEHAVVSGTTYIELKGGNVDHDIYGGGQGGPVMDEYGLVKDEDPDFVATTNVNIEGGMVRNVYGGGYLGHVGKHVGDINASDASDIPAVANVVIGKKDGTSFLNGIPAVMRNAYGGGEGGSVYGTTNLTLNNGYVGYRYKNGEYVEELDDQRPNAIVGAGNLFGGGYVVNSYVDNANVSMYGGTVRGSMYGGGELGPIGCGTTNPGAWTGGAENDDVRIFRAGKTCVKLYDGWVKRNVFGGGRGQDSWGGDGTLYMDRDLVDNLRSTGLMCKGYVFGQTEVNIYGGEVGTDDGVARGEGNVFGGGDIGFVYSAYKDASGNLSYGKKAGTRYDDASEGYYYKYENGAYVQDGSEKILTEDCKVLVEPWCKAQSGITINGRDFAAGEYVPTEYLNHLGTKGDPRWASLSKTDVNKEGILIHNAVFGGGNTSPGSTEVYASTTTVFGNATASIHDVYDRDLITIGTGHTGGLYGDGNLTLVDGYRELNITNYGTDFYWLQQSINLEEYKALSNREAAYYEIRYKCAKSCRAYNGRTYAVESTISADELQSQFVVQKDGVYESVKDGDTPIVVWDSATRLWVPNPNGGSPYWVENGVRSRYAGRIMNTIQRADFCGVWGSRMVMQGAQDRVPATVDYTNYTINRVREVSLNKRTDHGNYFGIHNKVNFLGALTSDVDFGDGGTTTIPGDIRTTDNDDADTYQCAAGEGGKAYGTATFYDWKAAYHDERKRNNGNSHNKVALASGVYLELTTEKSTGTGLYEKDWGYITGVVELDLINVQPGMGGGFVYAKNVHGKRHTTGLTHTTLTSLNGGAVTRKKYSYDLADANKEEWQTSGNFVHSTQTIIDDCYNIGDRYKTDYLPPDGVPAHYWFIKGTVYIYDQYISAYTGVPNAYSEVVNIPLTISSASHGRMKLLEVQPNYYAYYSTNNGSTQTPLQGDDEIVLRDVTYKLNDPITYWDYFMLSDSEKKLFVDKTYVTSDSCKIGDTFYPSGYVMLPKEYNALLKAAETKDLTPDDDTDQPVPAVLKAVADADGNPIVEKDETGNDIYKAFTDVFHESNNLSHDLGYMLTYNVDNPSIWDTWYTKKDNNATKNQAGGTDYEDGPTYTPTVSGLYGQQDYEHGNIIPKEVYDTYQNIVTNHSAAIPSDGQAEFEPAYIVTADILETVNKSGTPQRFYKGATLCRSEYTDDQWTAISGSVAPAYVVTSSVQLTETDFIYRGSYMKEADRTTYYDRYKDGTDDEKKIAAEIEKNIVPAYYCSTPGKYGGDFYQTGHSYRGLATWSSMSEEDRKNFRFNYDALDLLVDPNFSWNSDGSRRLYGDGLTGGLFQYDGTTDKNSDGYIMADDVDNPPHYSLETPINYTATYRGDTKITYTADDGTSTDTDHRRVLTNTEYERLLNERRHYSPVNIKKVEGKYPKYYVVNTSMILGDTPYAAGQVLSQEEYNALTDSEKSKITTLTFADTAPEGVYYYCRDSYTIASTADGGMSVAASTYVTEGGISGTYAVGATVPPGVVIEKTAFEGLTNNQANFAIHGKAPTETSTLYVARGSDIKDLSTEKIITVVYEYSYDETDMKGMNIVPVSERHVLNIHLQFKSGVPTVEDIEKPDIILPGTTVSIKEPFVTPGAYEVTGGGWELFDNKTDAEGHINGIEYSPNMDPLYLYQNNYLVAYYARTYLGKTYSNSVPVTVANYHDLKKVMDATDHHYYIDHKDLFNKPEVIEPKIYINDYSGSSKDGLDLLKNLYDLSVLNGSAVEDLDVYGHIKEGDFAGHKPLRSDVAAGNNLQFFLRTDIDRTGEWTPIGSSTETCFEGILHGDGHTLSGLDHSLFNHLCGDVYNLGVTGSFTGAGIAETGSGYVENCWINTTGTPEEDAEYAVFGYPSATSKPKQIVNCYYQEGKPYKTAAAEHGVATPKPERAFYNGEVAYDLNGFYLYKRYSDQKVTSGTEDQGYQYYTVGQDNKLELQPVAYYGNHPEQCSSGYLGTQVPMYVEDRFADGDFRYAAGTIPTVPDERLYVDTENDNAQYFFPIWPDDYIFFGQMLTYGYGPRAHQDVPTAVTRSDGRLSQAENANRVYRAPAYYQSKFMGSAHFNPNVYLAQRSADGTREAYPGMTAIDFKGHNDTNWGLGTVSGSYAAGKAFYPPLLDDDGLLSIKNCDETQNLLAYSPAQADNDKTYSVLNSYFTEPAYADHYDNTEGYRRVAGASTSAIYGHLVQSDLTTTSDHLLVDRQDFNCPISYDLGSGLRMWYQRTPDTYVDRSTGWEGISIPFSAELVTTSQKGEITHFYSGSRESTNGTHTKVGHEYWLRQFDAITPGTDSETAVANFGYPASAGGSKNVTNKFLWDYYYSKSLRRDANTDIYQEYYRNSRSYASYPLLAAAQPYLIGFPGDTYYEFDLSGTFVPQNTYASIASLDRQTVTFASNPAITIGVSDDETAGVERTLSDGGKDYTFVFKPSYMNTRLDAGTDNYTLSALGDSYNKLPDTGDATTVSAFRPYFSATSSSGAKEYKGLKRTIVFSKETAQMYEEEPDDIGSTGKLIIRATQGKIIVTSTMDQPKDVTIVSAAGATIGHYTIQPGETRETPVTASGIYIVNRKKLSVKIK